MAKNPQMKASRGSRLGPQSTPTVWHQAIMMSEYLERLRFLRRALDDGLIAQEDFALQRKRLLHAATSLHAASQQASKTAQSEWYALIATLVDLLETIAKQRRPANNRPMVIAPAKADDDVFEARQVCSAPKVPGDDDELQVEQIEPHPRDTRARFAFSKTGKHLGNKRSISVEFDPLEVAVDALFSDRPASRSSPRQEEERPAAATRGTGARRECVSAPPKQVTGRRFTAAKPLPCRPPSNGCTPLPVYRPVRPAAGGGAVALQKKKISLASENPRRRPVAGRMRCAPGAVRCAAQYVAHAAGLNRENGPKGERGTKADAGDLRPYMNKKQETASCANDNSSRRAAAEIVPAVRFTLHAEVFL